jgi:hypothetical protein
MIVLQGGVVNPTPNPQLSWRTNVFCWGCPPWLVGPNLKVSGTRSSPLHDLKTLTRSHDVDVHASDLVGIDGITRVLIVHISQQDVCPRGHILPLQLSSYSEETVAAPVKKTEIDDRGNPLR